MSAGIVTLTYVNVIKTLNQLAGPILGIKKKFFTRFGTVLTACVPVFMCGGHRNDSSTSRNGRVSKWAGHWRARDKKCCLQLIIGRMSESLSTAAVIY